MADQCNGPRSSPGLHGEDLVVRPCLSEALALDPLDQDLLWRRADLSRRLREATINAITGAGPTEARTYAQRASGLRAALDEANGLLTTGERALLDELLDRLADAHRPG